MIYWKFALETLIGRGLPNGSLAPTLNKDFGTYLQEFLTHVPYTSYGDKTHIAMMKQGVLQELVERLSYYEGVEPTNLTDFIALIQRLDS